MVELNEYRLLPEGVHRMTVGQIEALFGRFQGSDRRSALFAKLMEFLAEIRKTGEDIDVIVDGSFVMGCVDSPSDIDILLLIPNTVIEKTELAPFEYNVLSRKGVRQRYAFDVIPAPKESPEAEKALAYFMQIKPDWQYRLNVDLPARKGLIKVVWQ